VGFANSSARLAEPRGGTDAAYERTRSCGHRTCSGAPTTYRALRTELGVGPELINGDAMPSPLQNWLFAALPENVQRGLVPHLEPVDLPVGKVLYEAGDHQARGSASRPREAESSHTVPSGGRDGV
jgi:hypothetical protein